MENTNIQKKKGSLKEWIRNHRPTKRRIIQLYAALLTNANLKGFGNDIYKGKAKYACVPGLNCYSCPGAAASCPLGALQNALAGTETKLPYYIFGILILYGFLFGRWICGFLCPFGLIQDLLHKIKTPKIKKNRFTRIASYFKYILLVTLVIILPLIYAFQNFPLPAFCKYICPSGILLGAGGLLSIDSNAGLFSSLGPLFTWKFMLLVIFIVGAVFIYRFFCRFFCPLGALYGLFNKISLLGMDLNKSKCVDCGLCIGACQMDVLKVGDHECISCGRCVNACPTGAITYKGPKILLAPNEVGGRPVAKQINVDPCDYPGTPLPKKTKIARLAVGITMAAVLGGALIYYNVIDKIPEPSKTPPPPPPTVPTTATDPTAPTDEIIDAVVGGEVGNICPDFEMTLYNAEGTVKPSDSKGKITIINFWDRYCSGCVKELQTEFPKVHETYGDQVEMLIVHSYQEYGLNIGEYIQETFQDDWGFTHCRDAESEALYTYVGGTGVRPLTIILDENGIIQHKILGSIHFEDLQEAIEAMLNKEEPEKPTEPEPSDPPVIDAVVGGEIGNLCPDYEMTLYNADGTVRPSSSRGKITVINFWDRYCSGCVKELQTEFPKVHENYGENVEMLIVHSYQEYGLNIGQYIQETFRDDCGYTHCRDVESEALYTYLGGTGVRPLTVILDENGIIQYKILGSAHYDQLKEAIDTLMAD